MKCRFKLLALALLTFTTTSWLGAQVVDHTATGTFRYSSSGYGGIYDAPFSISFSYDLGAGASYTSATQGQYPGISLTYTVDLYEGSWSHTVNNPTVSILNGQYADNFQVTSPTGGLGAPLFQGKEVNIYKIELSGGTTVFDDISLPSELDFSDWGSAQGTLYFTSGWPSSYNMTVDNLSAVPEPSTWALIAGITAFGTILYRRRRG